MRIDQALVENHFFKTRTKAKEAILTGMIYYQGQCIQKPAFDISDIKSLEVKGEVCPYVSRGGLKLEKALKTFCISLQNKEVVDIGSSTGGFTDCALHFGAKHVFAIDVGSHQFDSELQKNQAITLMEQTDFRTLDLSVIKSVNVATIDVAFISALKLLPQLSKMSNLREIICLIKPQFECGKQIADKYKGVISNPKIHEKVIHKICSAFCEKGFYCHGLDFSPITGGSGNREYLAYFCTTHPTKEPPDVSQVVQMAFRELK